MIGRRAVTGLSLLCALVFCAIGASSASAAKGMTAFECVEKGGGAFKYSDADCDVTNAEGKFGHVEITKEAEFDTKLVSANYKLNTTLLTLVVEVNCTEQTSIGKLKNVAGPPMKGEGTGEITFNGCTVSKPAKCLIKQPIVFKAAVKSVIINEAKEEHGLEYAPAEAGGNFGEITFQNKSEAEKCAIANGGKAYPIKGTAIGTGSATNMTGAIQRFKKTEAPMQKLTVGGEPFTLEGETTVTNKATGNAIALTTTAT